MSDVSIHIDPKTGFKYYKQLPPGFRLATIDDFFDAKKNFILNKPFLATSAIDGNYQCYRTKRIKSFEWIKPLIDEKRVYVVA